MKGTTKSNKINRITAVVSKIMEVIHWIGVVCLAAVICCSIFVKDFLSRFYLSGNLTIDPVAEIGGFELLLIDPDGVLNPTAIILLCITGIIILTLNALMFRNVYRIVRNSADTPFNKDNTRMLREIGLFSIAVPIAGFLMSIVSRLILRAEFIEISVDLTGIVMGILVLFLTQIFAHGEELEKDVDGLL